MGSLHILQTSFQFNKKTKFDSAPLSALLHVLQIVMTVLKTVPLFFCIILSYQRISGQDCQYWLIISTNQLISQALKDVNYFQLLFQQLNYSQMWRLFKILTNQSSTILYFALTVAQNGKRCLQ